MDPDARIRTRHAELTVTQVAESLPGTGELMRSTAHCFAMSAHAAEGGNWDLAAYYLRRTRGLLRSLAVTRPKYAAQLGDYDRSDLERAYQALLAKDLPSFRDAFADATERANEYHVETGHAYIRWRLPDQPPDPGLDLSGSD